MIEPFVFCLKAEFNRSEDKPKEMGRAMFICITAGVLAIVNTFLLGAFYLNKKLNSVPDLVICNHSINFEMISYQKLQPSCRYRILIRHR